MTLKDRLAAAVATCWLGVFAWTAAFTFVPYPFWDLIDWIAEYRNRGLTLAALWYPHNAQHLVFARILTALAFGKAGLGAGVFVAAAVLALTASALIVAASLERSQGSPCRILTILLFFTIPAAVDVSIPINTVYLLALVWVVAALALMARDVAAARGTGLALATVAAMGSSVGLAVWPCITISAFRAGGWRWGLASFTVGTITVVAFAHGMVFFGHSTVAVPDLVQRLGAGAVYVTGFLGLPFSRSALLSIPGHVFGALLMLGGLAAIARFWIGEPRTAAERFVPGLAAFSLIAAVMAAIGRAHEGGIPVRYAVLVTPLQAALLIWAAPRIEAGWRRPRFATCLLGCLVILFGTQLLGARAAIAEARTIQAEITAFRSGGRGPAIARVVYPDPDRAARIMHVGGHDRR